MYKYILFDLDGTVINSEKGITEYIKYALNKLDYDYSDLDFKKFIGPSLYYSFGKFCGFDYEKQKQAVAYYREIYEVKNVYECNLYDGVFELLKKLKSESFITALATAKPKRFAKIILDNFNVTQFFDVVEGITSDEQTKIDVINLAMKNSGAVKAQTVMVGDRENDVSGANACGIHSIGVTYGFGDRNELVNAEATYVVDSPCEVYNVLIEKKS
ncbi:MAG: HAD hydrolase-like protein [Christensenellaceae bacterium]